MTVHEKLKEAQELILHSHDMEPDSYDVFQIDMDDYQLEAQWSASASTYYISGVSGMIRASGQRPTAIDFETYGAYISKAAEVTRQLETIRGHVEWEWKNNI